MKDLNISVGVSDFTEIRKNGYYYIDKFEFENHKIMSDYCSP